MKVYTFVNKNFESSEMGSDGLIYLDGRLNNCNKVIEAKKHIERTKNSCPSFAKNAVYIAPFYSSNYDHLTGKYLYKTNLIKL